MDDVKSHIYLAIEAIEAAMRCAIAEKRNGIAIALIHVSGFLDVLMNAEIANPPEKLVDVLKETLEDVPSLQRPKT